MKHVKHVICHSLPLSRTIPFSLAHLLPIFHFPSLSPLTLLPLPSLSIYLSFPPLTPLFPSSYLRLTPPLLTSSHYPLTLLSPLFYLTHTLTLLVPSSLCISLSFPPLTSLFTSSYLRLTPPPLPLLTTLLPSFHHSLILLLLSSYPPLTASLSLSLLSLLT